jgi:DNA-binding CsgD family transcriptional regulator
VRTPASDTGHGPARLTDREREVAALVCEGLTNRQVGRRMLITEKTVEMHVSRVYRKLNVCSRVGLLRALWVHSGPAGVVGGGHAG